MHVAPPVLSIHDFLLDRDAGLAAEVERHRDRSMTVVSLSGNETITRCGTCPWEDVRPCTVLRIMALPYVQHPAYRPEWRIARLEVVGRAAEESRVVVTHGRVPRPYPRIADMPPPGNARRRLLREFGITVSRSDFTDEELESELMEHDTASDARDSRPRAD